MDGTPPPLHPALGGQLWPVLLRSGMISTLNILQTPPQHTLSSHIACKEIISPQRERSISRSFPIFFPKLNETTSAIIARRLFHELYLQTGLPHYSIHTSFGDVSHVHALLLGHKAEEGEDDDTGEHGGARVHAADYQSVLNIEMSSLHCLGIFRSEIL
jgi:hypothetical protein